MKKYISTIAYFLLLILNLFSFTSCDETSKDNLTKDQILQLLFDVNQKSQEHKAYFQENEVKDILQQFDSLMKLVQDDTPSLLEFYNQMAFVGLQDDIIPPLYSELFFSVEEIIGCDQFKLKGDYTWNAEAQHWDLYKEDNSLSFQFPANLDGELVVLKYVETEVLDFEGVLKRIDWYVLLYKADERIFNLDLNFHRFDENILDMSFGLYHPEFGFNQMVYINLMGPYVDYGRYLHMNNEIFHGIDLTLNYSHFSIEDFIQGECSYIRSPLQIIGTFNNPDFYVKLDYDLEEFLKFSTPEEVAPYANQYLQTVFYYTPTEKRMVGTTWYFNSYHNMLEPFLEFDNGDTEPLIYYYPYIQILYIEDSAIQF